jgi:endonuclease/exonuclease/phosphatase family metal-dependent hydrolase
MKAILKIFKALLVVALLVGMLLVGLILHATYTNYKPADSEPLQTQGTANDTIPNEFSFLIWNVGYCGLGKESDFFYDGGKRSIPTREWSAKNLAGVTDYLAKNKTDFVLLQEVDRNSRRSYFTDQVSAISSALGNYNTTFATNYKVSFVPMPFSSPMGKVLSGLASYSRFKPSQSTRYQLPGSFEWPKSVYFLDRCILLQRYPMPNGKDLVVINSHHSAYDGGKLKESEMAFVRQLYLDEYDKKGNYVVVGGDWNQSPPKFDPNTFLKSGKKHGETSVIPHDFLPGWMWIYDPTIPTNREVSTPYNPNTTYTTVIDFYLISPNVELVKVNGIPMGFEFSDHQPLYMKVKLRPEEKK